MVLDRLNSSESPYIMMLHSTQQLLHRSTTRCTLEIKFTIWHVDSFAMQCGLQINCSKDIWTSVCAEIPSRCYDVIPSFRCSNKAEVNVTVIGGRHINLDRDYKTNRWKQQQCERHHDVYTYIHSYISHLTRWRCGQQLGCIYRI